MKYRGGMGYYLIYSDESLATQSQYLVVEPSDIKLSTSAIFVNSQKTEKLWITSSILQ